MLQNNFRVTFIVAAVCISVFTTVTYAECPFNEVLVDSGLACPDNSCYSGTDCPRKPSGKMECRCQDGYVRNYKTGNGMCIKPINCPVDLAAECYNFGGNWTLAGEMACEKSCTSPDICVHFIAPHDHCYCGLEHVREYWPDGECILANQCRNESSYTKSQYTFLFICMSAYYYVYSTYIN